MKKIDLSKCPKYKQTINDTRTRIITIVKYSNKMVTAACKEFDTKDGGNETFYHYTYRQSLARETASELIEKAKKHYNIKEEQKIN